MNKFLILITSIVFLLTSITYSKTSDLIVFGQNSGNAMHELSVSEELETDYTFETVDLSMWPDFL